MDLAEAYEATITYNQAKYEIENHGETIENFLKDYPKWDGVASDVLDWLGY